MSRKSIWLIVIGLFAFWLFNQPKQGFAVQSISDADAQNVEIIGRYQTPGWAGSVAVNENTAYVAERDNGLHLIDITNPTTPAELSFYSTPVDAEDIVVAGNVAFVTYNNALHLIDVTNPASPAGLGAYATAGQPNSIEVVGNIAYVANGLGGLRIFDIVNPTDPISVGAYQKQGRRPEQATDVAINGAYAFVAYGSAGLVIVDISNPANPSEISSFTLPGFANAVAVTESTAIVTVGETMHLVDVSNPFAPTSTGAYELPGFIQKMVAIGKIVYVADDNDGLRIVDIHNPSEPSEVGYYDTLGRAEDLTVIDDIIFVADGKEGLVILRYTGTDSPELEEPTGQIAFVSNRDGNSEIYLVNADGSDLMNLTNDSAEDFDPAWSPNGRQLAFISNRNGVDNLYLLEDVDNNLVKSLTSFENRVADPVWSPDGNRIAFAVHSQRTVGNANQPHLDIYWINSEGGEPVNVYSRESGLSGGQITWSNDSEQLLFDTDPSEQLYITDLNGIGNRFEVASDDWDAPIGNWGDNSPNWSPNGQQIAFHSSRFQGQNYVYVVDSDGQNLANISFESRLSGSNQPKWSPDNQWVSFLSNQSLYITRPDASDALELANLGSFYANWSWSPDASHLTFSVSGSEGQTDIHVVGVNGGNLINLTNHPAEDREPVWRPISPSTSADRLIAYIGSDENVWLIQEDGSGAKQLTEDGGYRLPQWSSEGRYLAVVRTASNQYPTLVQEIWVIDINEMSKRRIVEFRGELGNFPLGINNLDWIEENSNILFSVVHTRSPSYAFYKVDVTNEVTINFAYGSDDCECRIESTNARFEDIDFFQVGKDQIIGSILDKEESISPGSNIKWDLFSAPINLLSTTPLQTGCAGDERHPSISPFQKYIAYTCDNLSLHILDLSSMNDESIYVASTPPPDNFEDPALLHTDWSPDAKRIVFSFESTYEAAIAPPGGEIWVINQDGKGLYFLTSGSSPAWQPLDVRQAEPLYSVSGQVHDIFGDPSPGIMLMLDAENTVETNSQGTYIFENVPTGTYVIQPATADINHRLNPAEISIDLSGNMNELDFTAIPVTDLGFRPERNGYNFANRILDRSWDMFEQYYGSENVRQPDGLPCVAAEQYHEEVYRRAGRGFSCVGFSLTSLISFSGLSQPNAGAFAIDHFETLFSEPLSNELTNPIAYYSGIQRGQQWGDAYQDSLANCNTNSDYMIQALIEGIINNTPPVIVLHSGLNNMWHVVTPYRVEELAPNEVDIFIYDNEAPGQERVIHFELVNDQWQWTYTFVGTLSGAGIRSAGCTEFFLYPLEAALEQGIPPINFCEIPEETATSEQILILIPAGIELTIENNLGKRLDWGTGTLSYSEITDAQEIPQGFGLDSSDIGLLSLPSDAYKMFLGSDVDGSTNVMFFSDGRFLSVSGQVKESASAGELTINELLNEVTLVDPAFFHSVSLSFDVELIAGSRIATITGLPQDNSGELNTTFDGVELTLFQDTSEASNYQVSFQTNQSATLLSEEISLKSGVEHIIKPTEWENLSTSEINVEEGEIIVNSVDDEKPATSSDTPETAVTTNFSTWLPIILVGLAGLIFVGGVFIWRRVTRSVITTSTTTCLHCDTSNPAGSRYCKNCGRRLVDE